ncbi:unnamed protein product [Cyprideis torosa]|uniref:Uncharacterized protein n=1 Tax=Cyprideis torosa TaxID=163714 RepID=A0A7R8W409_9CRUS|nr:unnamed protein product [Cyprideis torosa]CAG0883634.1 unnamed protein product [Cyprideis torosa]
MWLKSDLSRTAVFLGVAGLPSLAAANTSLVLSDDGLVPLIQLYGSSNQSDTTLDKSQLENLVHDLFYGSENDIFCPPGASNIASSSCVEMQQCLAGSPLSASQIGSRIPALFRAIIAEKCTRHERLESGVQKSGPSGYEIWGYGILFVTLISLCSLVGALLLPLMGKTFYDKLLTTLIGLAVGSLTGSSLFHLLPQAFHLTDYDPHHSYLNHSLLAMCGIYSFFLIERLMKIFLEHRRRVKQLRISNLGISETADGLLSTVSKSVVDTKHGLCRGSDDSLRKEKNDALRVESACIGLDQSAHDIYRFQEQAIKASFGHDDRPERANTSSMISHNDVATAPIATVAWMIIFGDGLHNFIDGLSIGASFNKSILTGVSISLAVMCEEFPHELGDFAVLLHSGMSMRQALLYNFLSASICYVGLVIGILLGNVEVVSQYIFGFAGGMFLYIALTDMVPEMNEVAVKASKEKTSSAIRVMSLQSLGFLLGTGTLYLLAAFPDIFAIES